MKPFYMIIYIDYTGGQFNEWYDDTHEAWLRYEELRHSGEALKISVYTRMIWYPDEAE